jgi:hypothetical protein
VLYRCVGPGGQVEPSFALLPGASAPTVPIGAAVEETSFS